MHRHHGFLIFILTIMGTFASAITEAKDFYVTEAKDFYVDPTSGSASGDGSAANPWKSLQAVIDSGLVETRVWESLPYDDTKQLVPKNAAAPIKAGDTIYLRSGYHGELNISSHYNSAEITIAAQSGQTPRFKAVLLRSSSHWRIVGISVSAEFAPVYEQKMLMALESHAYSGPIHDIVVEGCQLRSVADISTWAAADWSNKACNGISASGSKITLRGNVLKNVNFGLSVSARDSLVERNLVENFAGDGMRGLGDHTVFQYNTIKNCYDVDDNHDDGFQSWSVGADGQVGTGEVVGIVLRGNTFINYEDPNQPLRGPLQGIGCFDGTFVDWVIENNVVIVDHFHGITLLGAKNCKIVNNTVLDPNGETPGPPWIRIGSHKDGTAPDNCVVGNNLAQSFNNEGVGVTEDHNIQYSVPDDHFVDVARYDLHLKESSSAVNAGAFQWAPPADIEGVARPQGAEVDVGAYEWTDSPPTPDASVADLGGVQDGALPSHDAGVARDLATGDLATGDLATGDLATGDLATGDLATGDLATGDLAIGDLAIGDLATGDTSPRGELRAGCSCDASGAGGGALAFGLLLALWVRTRRCQTCQRESE
ncbi:MAG: right-handed parallel beta-helix repeat-containing protein [Deltaproteobacteria bacterium]|nr:right-handed parallel beta-helix repeat-containing protein [Deltaproteobacteria bacterium]